MSSSEVQSYIPSNNNTFCVQIYNEDDITVLSVYLLHVLTRGVVVVGVVMGGKDSTSLH